MEEFNFNSEWRRVASAIYSRPNDSKMLGTVELDVTELEKYIASKRKEGVKTTLTYWFTLALSRGVMSDCPEFNTYVRRGNIVKRKDLDAMISVLLRNDQMGSVKVTNAHLYTIEEISEYVKQQIDYARGGSENETMQKKGLIARIPWPFRRWIAKLVRLTTVHWGISMPGINVSANSFGSFVVTNIGSIGLDMGLPALFPISNVSMVVTLGGIYKKPVIINDQVVPRRVITIGAAIDHRVVDAMQVGKLFRYLKRAVMDPAMFERKFEDGK